LIFGLTDQPAGPPESPVRNPGFTLFGPGFPGGLDIPAVGAAEALQLADAEFGPRELLGVLTLLVAGNVPPGGGDEEAVPDPDAVPDPEGDLIRFLLGLPEALPGTEPAAPAAPEEAFGMPPPFAEESAAAWEARPPSGEDALGLGRLEVPKLDPRPVLDAVFAARPPGPAPAEGATEAFPEQAVADAAPREGAEGRSAERSTGARFSPVWSAARIAAFHFDLEKKSKAAILAALQNKQTTPAAGLDSRVTAAFLAAVVLSAHRADGRARRTFDR
jgi:hypothetical protein